jgi:membrane-bound lytic murein transglycosylase D
VKKRIFLTLALLSACAPIQRNAEHVDEGYVSPEASRSPAGASSPVTDGLQTPEDIEKILAETNPVLSEAGGETEKVPLHIPIEINRNVSQWIKYFTEREREMFQRYLERGEALRPHIEQILKDNEVPPELYYLAMIESGFVRHAKSHAKAVGVWQFMPGTGRNYGLALNSQVDERRNWIKSTEAAASYLKDLNNVFGSWYLALAAYNAGEYRIVRAVMKGKTRDFWALAEAGLLPKETLNYVPKFLAAQIVGKNMRRFGFIVKVPPEDKWDPFETVSVPSGVTLKSIAKTTGCPLETLQRWNYDLIKGVTPATKAGTVDIYIPKQHLASFEKEKEAVAQLKKVKGFKSIAQKEMAVAKNDRDASYDIYVVRRGDNLSLISRRIKTSVRTLMKTNGLRKKKIHPGQRLKYYPPNTTSAKTGKKKSRDVAKQHD